MQVHQWPGLFAVFFLAIVFLQSGFDKLFNFKKELAWIRQKFARNILYRFISPIFIVLTFAEILSGIIAAVGVIQLLFFKDSTLAIYGAVATCTTLLMLLFGQRFTKDYSGAATLVPYFIVAILGLYFLI